MMVLPRLSVPWSSGCADMASLGYAAAAVSVHDGALSMNQATWAFFCFFSNVKVGLAARRPL